MDSVLNRALVHEAFAVLETTAGTLEFPAATDFIIPAGYCSLNQQPTFTDSEEIINSRSLINRFQNMTGAGEWSVPMYLRPSGSAGSVPQGSALLTALFGTETITGGTSVKYTLDKEKDSFSLWERCGKVVFFAKGCTASKCAVGITNKGAVKLDLSGGFMSMGWVGTDQLAADPLSGDTEVTPDDDKLFKVGGYVQFTTAGGTTYNNSNAGYEITAINRTTGVITLGTALEADLDIDDYIEPFLPTGTKIGSPTEARNTTVSFDGGSSNAKIKEMSINVDDAIEYQEDEITTEGYPTSYVEGRRSVTGRVAMLFRTNDLAYFYDGYAANTVDMQIKCGEDTAGKRLTINMDNVSLPVPRKDYTAPTVEMSMDFVALGTNGEDEIEFLLD